MGESPTTGPSGALASGPTLRLPVLRVCGLPAHATGPGRRAQPEGPGPRPPWERGTFPPTQPTRIQAVGREMLGSPRDARKCGYDGRKGDERHHVAGRLGTASSDSRHAPVEFNALNILDMRCYVPAEVLLAVAIALVSCVRHSESRATTGRPPSSIIIESPADFEIVDSDFTLKLKVLSTV